MTRTDGEVSNQREPIFGVSRRALLSWTGAAGVAAAAVPAIGASVAVSEPARGPDGRPTPTFDPIRRAGHPPGREERVRAGLGCDPGYLFGAVVAHPVTVA